MSAEDVPFKTLFLCTGNQARSLFAEYFLREIGAGLFDVESAAISPVPAPHSMALRILTEDFHFDVSAARSKSWEEFKDVHFDFVITLCDEAHEVCPTWPGQPIMAHWSSPDPCLVQGDDETVHRAFWQVAEQIRRRVELLASLPFEKLDSLRLTLETQDIGKKEPILAA